jgi:hypothetical protein
MKYALGVFALLLFVTTLALGQSYQPLPFPQEANTALQAGSADPSANMPSSMAANQESYTFTGEGDRVNLGSEFPSIANPVLGRDSAEMAPAWGEQHDLGSPFPSAANPSGDR